MSKAFPPEGNILKITHNFYWIAKLVFDVSFGWISCNVGYWGQCFGHWSYSRYVWGQPKGKICTKRPWRNFFEIAPNFCWMAKLVCNLGLGWISFKMGGKGAMLSAFVESYFESECESCSKNMEVKDKMAHQELRNSPDTFNPFFRMKCHVWWHGWLTLLELIQYAYFSFSLAP